MMDAVAYRDQLLALLPQGLAWPRDPDNALGLLLLAWSSEMARVDARANRLLDEADPRTTLELLPDWERIAGLPDTCVRRPETVAERRLAVLGVIGDRGGQSIAYFTEFAARYGYVITIEEGRSADVGRLRCGGRLGGVEWRFVWIVHVRLAADALPEDARFTVGSSTIGDRLAAFGAFDLECLFARAKPAHTVVIFIYETGE